MLHTAGFETALLTLGSEHIAKPRR